MDTLWRIGVSKYTHQLHVIAVQVLVVVHLLVYGPGQDSARPIGHAGTYHSSLLQELLRGSDVCVRFAVVGVVVDSDVAVSVVVVTAVVSVGVPRCGSLLIVVQQHRVARFVYVRRGSVGGGGL